LAGGGTRVLGFWRTLVLFLKRFLLEGECNVPVWGLRLSVEVVRLGVHGSGFRVRG